MAPRLFFYLLCSLYFYAINAQNISVSIPVPPLQWINLSNLLQGSTRPPPLRDASIGYDETSRSLIVFGGVSESGVPQSQTYLLNLQTLTWSTPSPPPNLQRTPPPRSLALSGGDFAASNRHGFVVIGGKGSNNEALADVWEYDFNNQFWSPVGLSSGGPSPRWGASGGIDSRTQPVSDPIIPGPNNTFYLAGGFNGKTPDPLSDVWTLKLSGTLSSNLPDSVNGSWDKVAINTLPGRVGQAGAVVSQQIIATGGCDSSASLTASNSTCSKQDSFIINTQSQSSISPVSCPAPRAAPVLVPNLNTFSSAFASQVLLMLGTFNTSLWEDSDGLANGEVAILDINTAIWTRIVPSGDPSSSPQFPSPRQGAAAITFQQALVGNVRSSSSDIIIFGGQDSNGAISSDLWLLRAYSDILTSTNSTFSTGQLQSGINADGSGVQVTFMTQCASLITTTAKPTPSSTGISSHAPTNTGSTGNKPSPTNPPVRNQSLNKFETSFSHKLLMALSLVLLTPVVLFFRWSEAIPKSGWIAFRRMPLVLAFTLLGVVAYGVGVAGFVFSFTSISSSTLSNGIHLKTGHGVAGLLFFVSLYVLVPLVYLFVCFDLRIGSSRASQRTRSDTGHTTSFVTTEKGESVPMRPRSITPSLQNTTPPTSPRPRAMSWDASMALQRPSHDDGGLSTESPPSSTPTPNKGFEVLNRGNRPRKLSGPWEVSSVPGARGRVPSTRRLGEIDWLLRRRSLNAVGELDYVITQAHNAQYFAGTNDESRSAMQLRTKAYYPTPRIIVLHILIHISILGLCAVTLAALWLRGRRYLFALFLIWVLVFYTAMFVLAWNGRPTSSLLTVTLWRLRGQSISTSASCDLPTPNTLRNSSADIGSSSTKGPYMHHRPPFHASAQADNLSYNNQGTPLSVGSDENDEDDIDEDTRQRLIEEEMERRDVSIVTVPRRKLYLTNPS